MGALACSQEKALRCPLSRLVAFYDTSVGKERTTKVGPKLLENSPNFDQKIRFFLIRFWKKLTGFFFLKNGA